MFEGSHGYSCEASFSTGVVGASCLLLRPPQSKPLAFSFAGCCNPENPVDFRVGRHVSLGLPMASSVF